LTSEMIWEGKTVENAVALASKELNRPPEQIVYEIIQEPVKGIFGMSKLAKIKVLDGEKNGNIDINKADTTENSDFGRQKLENMLKLMGISDFTIQTSQDGENTILNIASESEGLLIGRHGKTREAMQYIIDRMSGHEGKRKFIIDIGGYLNRRKEKLERMALQAASKVKQTNKEEKLEAMAAHERRIIHLLLKDNPDVKTYSVGDGTLRHVVIAPKSSENSVE
jgi:spoIIIJ-associated protein